MSAPKCECRVIYNLQSFGLRETNIAFCPLHQHAAELYEALEKLLSNAMPWLDKTTVENAREALRKARGEA